jgi:subtilisin family serine protease
METEAKISPAFAPFLAESGPNDKRDGIVIYRSPATAEKAPRGRLLELRHRLDQVKQRARESRSVEAKALAGYEKTGLTSTSIGHRALPVTTVEVTRRTLPELAARPDVVAILPNQKIHLIRPSAIDFEDLGRREEKDGLTWGLNQLDIPKLWKTTKGENITVAVLDTGVHAEHPALRGRVKDFVVIDPLGRRIVAKPAFDCDRHGTHVCGTIAGGKTSQKVSIGVAPEAKLLVGAVLIGECTIRTLLEGISWAIEKGANIISMSLGFKYYEPLFAKVFENLIDDYGILPVAAIGNENHGNSSSPGSAYNALAVGAIEKLPGNKTKVAEFSSGASLVFPGVEPNGLVTKPDVVAPGVQVYSCIPPEKRPTGPYEYAYMDGTSMATPHAAGVAALLMSAKPEVPTPDIIKVMTETARHPDGSSRRPDNRWGFGLLRPMDALKALG